ncbi:hypothetical protein WG909_04095 [Peptostreptococcaceae bacterium AGR-M142]
MYISKKYFFIILIITIAITLIFANLQKKELSYEEFRERYKLMSKSIKEDYTVVSNEDNILIVAYFGELRDKWSNSIGQHFKNDPAKEKKKQIYIQDENKDILTRIAFNYHPWIKEKEYLSMSELDNLNYDIYELDKEFNIPIIYTTSLTTNGMSISIFTFDVSKEEIKKEIQSNEEKKKQRDELVSKVHNDAVTYLQEIIINNGF